MLFRSLEFILYPKILHSKSINREERGFNLIFFKSSLLMAQKMVWETETEIRKFMVHACNVGHFKDRGYLECRFSNLRSYTFFPLPTL